jgi:hypothetical protein
MTEKQNQCIQYEKHVQHRCAGLADLLDWGRGHGRNVTLRSAMPRARSGGLPRG